MRSTGRPLVAGFLAGLFVLLGGAAPPASAQQSSTLYNQAQIGRLLERQGTGTLPEEPIPYQAYVLAHPSGNTVLARHALYEAIGEGDVRRGYERSAIALLLNGVALTALSLGDTLVLPARPEHFDLDPRAFAPFPLTYPGAASLPKLVVIDKDAQAWAAYAEGRLVRWGPASTGAHRTPTPTGRFTMNWRQEERISSESPEGQSWRMRWVMNFYFARGIHLHQYDVVPTGPPVGHGCVRVVETDARWLWSWTEPWVTDAGRGALGGKVLRQGTTVLVLGDEPKGAPRRFVHGPDGVVRYESELPPDPMKVPRGDR